MKNKFSTIYAIFASIIFCLTLIYFGFNLYTEYEHGYERTKNTFNQLTASAKKNSNNIKIADINDFSFIEISENGTTFYKYPSKDSVSDSSSKLIKNYCSSFIIDNNHYFISADLYLLRPASIRFYARNSFIIILIITLITILMIITITVSEKDTLKIQKNDNQDEDNQLSYDEFEKSLNENKQIDLETDKNLENQLNNSEKLNLEAVTENNSANLEKTDVIKNEEEISQTNNLAQANTELPSNQVKPVELEQNDNNPFGLFSPKSGIGWESYLLPRLDNELNRAISSEFDLALFVIQIENINKDAEKLHQICDYLTIQFQFKDMLFEYKEDCIVAIKVSMSLDEAVSFADKIHTDIEDITAEKCYIGISTRTIRIISGERLLQEAEEALNHAKEEKDTPIIAFRANADKYRQYMEQNK